MQVQTPPTRSVTKSVTIDRSAAEVHAFLADAANWPRWAIINVLAVEPGDEPGWWKLSTPDGPAEFRIRADSATGLVDHDFRDETEEVATVPARVVGNGRGADFLMTITQPPGLNDTIFDELLASVDTELATLKKLMESAPASS
jgi:hypothetical protein